MGCSCWTAKGSDSSSYQGKESYTVKHLPCQMNPEPKDELVWITKGQDRIVLKAAVNTNIMDPSQPKPKHCCCNKTIINPNEGTRKINSQSVRQYLSGSKTTLNCKSSHSNPNHSLNPNPIEDQNDELYRLSRSYGISPGNKSVWDIPGYNTTPPPRNVSKYIDHQNYIKREAEREIIAQEDVISEGGCGRGAGKRSSWKRLFCFACCLKCCPPTPPTWVKRIQVNETNLPKDSPSSSSSSSASTSFSTCLDSEWRTSS